MLQVVVRHLDKVIDIKGDYEDVKGILAELEFSTRPAESRTGGVRVSLEDSVVSDPGIKGKAWDCLLYTSPSPRDRQKSRMPSSA